MSPYLIAVLYGKVLYSFTYMALEAGGSVSGTGASVAVSLFDCDEGMLSGLCLTGGTISVQNSLEAVRQ